MSTILDKADLVKSEVKTSATIVARCNVKQKPYDDQRVRNALQMAVDNTTILKLGIRAAEPWPKISMSPRSIPIFPAAEEGSRRRRRQEADDRRRSDRFRAQPHHGRRGIVQEHRRRDRGAVARGGLQGQAHGPAGVDLLERLDEIPVFMTDWNMRPLGVQVLALAYRTGKLGTKRPIRTPSSTPSSKRRSQLPIRTTASR